MYYRKREKEYHELNMPGKCLLGRGIGIGLGNCTGGRHFILGENYVSKGEREKNTWKYLWLVNRLI